MSTRYVWNWYRLETVYSAQQTDDSAVASVSDINYINFCSEFSIESNGFKPNEDTDFGVGSFNFEHIRDYNLRTYNYPYAILGDSQRGYRYCEAVYKYPNNYWQLTNGKLALTSTSNPEMKYYIWVKAEKKGASLGYRSGTSQSSYPSDGVQGSYWYTYQGSDNIDPTAVTYPSGPKSGVPITITVTPRANTYGGTISYQYEYSLDGGNVWNQLALTTAASRQYTIPKGTQTFRVRVQARDNMGFTSSDWIYGPQVNVVNNSAPSAPPTITVPVSPRGGAQTTITWTASSDVDGNLAGYELERQLDGGSWTSLYTGAGLSYLDTVAKGTATVAYRVRAYDADGDYSGYTTSATRTVVNNNPPVITSSLSGDLGTKSAGFTVPYTVTDEEGGTVTVAEQVGNLVKRTHTPTLGQEQTFHVEDQDGDYFFTQILNGSQTVRITATDEGGLSSTLELSFTKAVHSMSVTLETPLEVEEAITVAIMSVLCGIPADASYQLLATNNAKDAEPVWQDVTADVAAGRNIIFTNQVQANGPAFNFKLSASRSEGGQGGYVKSLKGAFQ